MWGAHAKIEEDWYLAMLKEVAERRKNPANLFEQRLEADMTQALRAGLKEGEIIEMLEKVINGGGRKEAK